MDGRTLLTDTPTHSWRWGRVCPPAPPALTPTFLWSASTSASTSSVPLLSLLSSARLCSDRSSYLRRSSSRSWAECLIVCKLWKIIFCFSHLYLCLESVDNLRSHDYWIQKITENEALLYYKSDKTIIMKCNSSVCCVVYYWIVSFILATVNSW